MGLIQISHVQGRVPVTVFHIQDRVNLGNFHELEEAATQAYNSGTRDMILDLSNAPSLTSIGIRAMIIIHRLLSADHGRHLKLAGPAPDVRDMLDIAGVTQYIDIYDSVEEAVRSF